MIVLALALVWALAASKPVVAGREGDFGEYDDQQAGPMSTPVEYLVVRDGMPDSVVAVAPLEWQGHVGKALPVPWAVGSQGGQGIYVNDWSVRGAPGRSDAQSGRVGSQSGVEVTAVVTGSVVLASSYDGVLHTVWYQVPMSYTGTVSVPLVVRAHGMGGTGEDMVNSSTAVVAAEHGWLFVAPNMHGTYYSRGRRALAWPGAQHDIMDAIEYMQARYEVDPARIYIIGGSMGGQTVAVMAAKYPDVFAAAAEWKGFTDLADWYNNELAGEGLQIEIENETGGSPDEVPFEYQRRSAMAMPQNIRLVPLRIWHDVTDDLVWLYHSYDLRDAINSWSPPPIRPVEVITANTGLGHDYEPDPHEVFEFLEGFTLSPLPPPYIAVRTDESKPYYWLNLAQTGGDHWSQVQASYNVTDATVMATISDTYPLTVAFNLGSTPIMGRAIEQPGMGLAATTYLVNGGGNYRLQNYTSGYFTTTLESTGQFSLTISAVEATLAANPGMVLGGQAATSTITAVFRDHLHNPVPDGTIAHFSTSDGTFPNASTTYTVAAVGGQVTATLTLESAADIVGVIASVESVTGSVAVDVIHPAINVLVTPDQTTVDTGQAVTYTYRITNTGDITVTAVTLVDDNGTPEASDDDITICTGVTLTAEATTSFSLSKILTQTATNTATVIGQDPLGHAVTHTDSATVVVTPAKIYLPIVARNGVGYPQIFRTL